MTGMKDSGIEWIGKIPGDWGIDRAKFHYNNIKRVVGVKSERYDRLALTLSGVIQRPKDDVDGLQPSDFNGYQILKAGDLVFKLIDLQNVSTSRVGLAHDTGIVSPAYVRLESKPDTSARHGEYYFLSMWQREVFNQLGDAGVRSNLSSKDLLELPYLSLPIIEQEQIADFLDEKCAEIDKLSEDIRKQIDVLNDYKKSVITRAVTKGLNSNVKMKDSGVQWFEQLPASWNRGKLLYYLRSSICDGPHETPNYVDVGIPFISVDSLGDSKTVDLEIAKKFISEADYLEYMKKTKLTDGDILFTKAATIGKTAIVQGEKFMVWSPIAIIKANPFKINNSFLYYLLNCPDLVKSIELSGSYNTQANVGMREMERAVIPVPGVLEQAAIVDYLDSKCSAINYLISQKNNQLLQLLQYKKSLIYEYVTGKKRVKGVL